jgi:hypothetical protein
LFLGGSVFDGTGAPPAVAGRTLLPGLFDCDTYVMVSHVDLWRHLTTPFSYPLNVSGAI